MSGTYIEELGDIYSANVIEEGETVGNQDQLDQNTDALTHSGPEAAEGFDSIENDPKKADEGHVENLSQPTGKKGKKAVKKESKEINNSRMKEQKTNKSTFDRLFEDVMGGDLDMELGDEGGLGDDLGDDLGGDEEGLDTISIDLPRDVAEQLHSVLGELLGGEEDIEDIEDVEGGDEFGGDEFENIESHVELTAAPDSTASLQGMNNKVSGSGHAPSGGSASADAHGQEDGGKPKGQPEGFTHAKTKNNKVGGKVTGGNKDLFKA